MNHIIRLAAGVAFLAATASSAPVFADDQDVIDYRQHAMKSMGEQMAAIAQILQQKAPADHFATHLQTIAVIAATTLKTFEPNVAGGESKPEVWTNWADFSKRMNEFSANAAELAKAGTDGGIPAVGPKLQAALACDNCHDVYRVQKK
jgi:cytochrome c556